MAVALRWLLMALLLSCAVGADRALDGYGGDPNAPPPGTDLVRSFLGNLSYEIRGTLSRLLYLKIDRYVHEGKKLDLGDGVQGVTTVDNTEIVPLYGLITYLDPHFIEAFSFGANHLIDGLNKPREGFELLQAGIERNPDDPLTSELLGQLAVYHLRDSDEPAKAIAALERALPLRRRLAEEDVPRGFVFSVPQLTGLLAIACYKTGDRQSALRWLREPNNLPHTHELYGLLGVKPPPVELLPPVRPLERHEHEHEATTPADERRLRMQNPLWWLDAERSGAFFRGLIIGGALVLVLAWPGWGRIARARR